MLKIIGLITNMSIRKCIIMIEENIIERKIEKYK